ncbi:hypothetical protein [Candidatus Poriferisocius sp.]|uniref:hypothetical protein n=1 Tax=Candidatus Poriferisocius sp. TaxID=3101276 RepID=UPI003B0240EC
MRRFGIPTVLWKQLAGAGVVALSLVAVAAFAPSSAVAQDSTSDDTTTQVRIVARKLENGRVEFALQPAETNNTWGDRLLPKTRYFPPTAPTGRWLASSPITIGTTKARIVARKLENGRIEFALQPAKTDNTWGDRLLPKTRYFPPTAPTGRWLASSPLEIRSTTTEEPPPTNQQTTPTRSLELSGTGTAVRGVDIQTGRYQVDMNTESDDDSYYFSIEANDSEGVCELLANEIVDTTWTASIVFTIGTDRRSDCEPGELLLEIDAPPQATWQITITNRSTPPTNTKTLSPTKLPTNPATQLEVSGTGTAVRGINIETGRYQVDMNTESDDDSYYFSIEANDSEGECELLANEIVDTTWTASIVFTIGNEWPADCEPGELLLEIDAPPQATWQITITNR